MILVTAPASDSYRLLLYELCLLHRVTVAGKRQLSHLWPPSGHRLYLCMCLLHGVMIAEKRQRGGRFFLPSGKRLQLYVIAAQGDGFQDSLQVVTVYTYVCVCRTGVAGFPPSGHRLYLCMCFLHKPISGHCLYLCMCLLHIPSVCVYCRIPSKWSPSIPLYVFPAQGDGVHELSHRWAAFSL